MDVACRLLPEAADRATIVAEFGLRAGAFVLATFHRSGNLDDAERLGLLLEHLAELDLPVLFPVHPRTRQRMQAFGFDGKAKGVHMVAPLGYKAFLGLAAECAFLLSDSGGIQEEANVVKRPAIVVRESTERPEVLGTFATLVPRLTDLPGVAVRLIERLDDTHRRLIELPSPADDGHASARCVQHIALVLRKGA